MSKVCWVVVSDSGLIAISGGRKNRMKYEMVDEFQKKKPAYNEELVYRPLWGKTLRPLAYEVRTAMMSFMRNAEGKTPRSTFSFTGRETNWSDQQGSKTSQTGLTEVRMWTRKAVYYQVEQSIRILAGICRRAESAVLLTSPKSDLYGFGPVWDLIPELPTRPKTKLPVQKQSSHPSRRPFWQIKFKSGSFVFGLAALFSICPKQSANSIFWLPARFSVFYIF